MPKISMYELFLKKLFDLTLSMVMIIVLSPIILIIALMVRVFIGKPVIYKQERPGLNEKIFTIYKFRTMKDLKDDDGKLLPDGRRLTKFGKVLRSLSLDELPELYNIIRGDMSFVGPRPLLVKYLDLYNDHQKKRHRVRPGLTGLAQVNGRNAISWDEKFNLDIKYVEKVHFWTDIRIVLKTIIVVFKKSGVSSNTSVTMEEFKGND